MAPKLRTAAGAVAMALGLACPARAQQYPPPPAKQAPATASPQFSAAPAQAQQYYLIVSQSAPAPPPAPTPAGAHALTWGRPGPIDRLAGRIGRRLYERGLPRLRVADPAVIQAVILPVPAAAAGPPLYQSVAPSAQSIGAVPPPPVVTPTPGLLYPSTAGR